MALPRLVLGTQDKRDIARVIRGALRLRVEVVQLVAPPATSGQHFLEITVPGVGHVSLLAEPAGPARPDGHPLSMRPVNRVQMAELFALVEGLDEPLATEPPPPEQYEEAWENDDGPPDGDTMVDDVPAEAQPPWAPSRAAVPGTFGELELDGDFAPGPTSVPPPPRPRAPSAPAMAAHPHSNDKRVGRVLAGKYQIDAPIGSGAAATVYRAMHKDLRRPVAVKILHAEHQAESQFIRRFKAEALTASKLDHANVTRIIDFGAERGELYLVMELVNGRSLEAVVAAEGPLEQKRVIDIGIQVCRALAFAHEHGVIHRDIKPENVMVVPDKDDDGNPCDLVKVCDFGLAKLREPVDDDSEEITMSGMLCGSPAYMSPEQTRGDTLDARSDIYTLGITLFEALTGALPYEAFNLSELFVKKCTMAPRRVSELVNVHPRLDAIITRAMSIDPHDRQASARDFRAELRTAREAIAD